MAQRRAVQLYGLQHKVAVRLKVCARVAERRAVKRHGVQRDLAISPEDIVGELQHVAVLAHGCQDDLNSTKSILMRRMCIYDVHRTTWTAHREQRHTFSGILSAVPKCAFHLASPLAT